MELTSEDVLQIMKFLENASFTELRLEMGGLKLELCKGNEGGRMNEDARGTANPSRPAPGESAQIPRNMDGRNDPPVLPTTPPAGVEPEKEGGLLPIRAPMLGTFYRTPKPGAPPFVEVGQMVTEEDPVGIIEVMKLFTTVKAGLRGRVARVCVEQGQMVEFQQPLFLVEKA